MHARPEGCSDVSQGCSLFTILGQPLDFIDTSVWQDLKDSVGPATTSQGRTPVPIRWCVRTVQLWP